MKLARVASLSGTSGGWFGFNMDLFFVFVPGQWAEKTAGNINGQIKKNVHMFK